jgi:dTDP-4-amino-4,6-dideoxygalactose transaminase
VHAVFHYVPLHSSPAGRRFARVSGDLPVTVSAADRVVRLPLWAGMSEDDVEHVIDASWEVLAQPSGRIASRVVPAERRSIATEMPR